MDITARDALVSAAQAEARRLCDAALATLARGDTVYVKGKKTIVPASPERRRALYQLQCAAFEPGYRLDHKVIAVLDPLLAGHAPVDDATGDAIVAEAASVYSEAGTAAVEAAFAA